MKSSIQKRAVLNTVMEFYVLLTVHPVTALGK